MRLRRYTLSQSRWLSAASEDVPYIVSPLMLSRDTAAPACPNGAFPLLHITTLFANTGRNTRSACLRALRANSRRAPTVGEGSNCWLLAFHGRSLARPVSAAYKVTEPSVVWTGARAHAARRAHPRRARSNPEPPMHREVRADQSSDAADTTGSADRVVIESVLPIPHRSAAAPTPCQATALSLPRLV